MKKNIRKRTSLAGRAALLAVLFLALQVRAGVIFEKYSQYNHVQVIDNDGIRMLSFNGTSETRMSITNPLQGHFEYTEYFHMPWLWNHDMQRVLMIGLGGGSTQRSYQHYYTNVTVETAEIDPVVIDVAKKYFTVAETPHLQIRNLDGRVFLRRSTNRYDAIILDAYTTTRYGSSLPPHLTTREFFRLASEHMTTNGVLAYNVIGQTQGWQQGIVAAIYRTLREVFPQVYLFPAVSSRNVVLIATKSPGRFDAARVQREAADLVNAGILKLPAISDRLRSFVNLPPPAAATCPVLTDAYAPVEALMSGYY